MPKHASSDLWMSNTDVNFIGITSFGGEQTTDTVLSSGSPTVFTFLSTPTLSLVVPDVTTQHTEGGMGITIQQTPGTDNHALWCYSDTGQCNEIYQPQPAGYNQSCTPTPCNGGGGQKFFLNSFVFPIGGNSYFVGAGGGPYTVTTVHQSEINAAAAGDVHAIKHMIRMTQNAASINRHDTIWPATSSNGSNGCRADSASVVNTSGTAITATTGLFRTAWPAVTPVLVNGVANTLTVLTGTTGTLGTSAGSQTGVAFLLPNTDCMPYGSIPRVKSTYTPPSFDGTCATTGCQNIVLTIIQTLKDYGGYVTDIGGSWALDVEGTQNSLDASNAVLELGNGHPFTSLTSPTNMEIADISTLQTNQTYSGTDPNWFEAKLNNGTITPQDAAVVKVTDSASATAFYSIALQGVAVGVPSLSEVVMSCASPVQFTAWSSGSSSTALTWAISPSGSDNGTITSGGLYTPACPTSTRTVTTATVTHTLSGVTQRFTITILPTESNGSLNIGLGKQTSTSYSATGLTWQSDQLTGTPDTEALFPNNNTGTTSFASTWTGSNTATAPSLYNLGQMGVLGDFRADVWVANGTHTVTLYISNPTATATGQARFSLLCNGVAAVTAADLFTATGATLGTSAQSCSFTGNRLQLTFRNESASTTPLSGFSIVQPCCTVNTVYLPDNAVSPFAVPFVAGMNISAAAPGTPTSVLRTDAVLKTTSVMH